MGLCVYFCEWVMKLKPENLYLNIGYNQMYCD